MSGPPRTPTPIRKARGNPGKRPYNRREPTFSVGVPAVPAGLNPVAGAEWRRLIAVTSEARTLCVADRGILELAAKAYATWVAAEEVIAANGLTYETTTTTGARTIKAHPACAIASDAWRRYRAALCELGLTPAARTKVTTLEQPEAKDPAERYFAA